MYGQVLRKTLINSHEMATKHRYHISMIQNVLWFGKIENKGLTRKKRLIKILGGKCEKCQKVYIPPVYDFHHIKPSEKSFTLNQPNLAKYSWDMIKQELKKVALLCANCHRIIHATHDKKFFDVTA